MISNVTNLIARRDLLRELIVSELRSSTAQTRLGWLWWLLDPLLMMGVYWLIVVELLGRGRSAYDPYWLFIFFGLITWKHFTGSINRAARVLSSRQSLIRSVPFPTIVLPLSGVLSMFFFFLCGFGVLVLMAVVARPEAHSGDMLPLIQVPLLMAVQVLIVIGLALPISCLGVLYRDFAEFLPHVLHGCFFLSPVLYGVDVVQRAAIDRFGPQWGEIVFVLYMLNPFAAIISGYRDAMFYGTFMDARMWIILLMETVVILIPGYLMYLHYDRRVVKFL